ncbi:MAG: endo-1,4-beta-xylanase [Lachnospiraceae bacterium]
MRKKTRGTAWLCSLTLAVTSCFGNISFVNAAQTEPTVKMEQTSIRDTKGQGLRFQMEMTGISQAKDYGIELTAEDGKTIEISKTKGYTNLYAKNQKEDTASYTAVVTDIDEKNFSKEIQAKGFVTYEKDGREYTQKTPVQTTTIQKTADQTHYVYNTTNGLWEKQPGDWETPSEETKPSEQPSVDVPQTPSREEKPSENESVSAPQTPSKDEKPSAVSVPSEGGNESVSVSPSKEETPSANPEPSRDADVSMPEKPSEDETVSAPEKPSEEEKPSDVETPSTPGENVPVTGITIAEQNKELKIGETFSLNAQVQPENATNKNVIYTSNKPEFAEVDENGVVTAKHAGIASITAATEDGNKQAVCIVTVVETAVSPSTPSQAPSEGETPSTPTDTTETLDLKVADKSENTTVKENADGSLTVSFTNDYDGVIFALPEGKTAADYFSVTVDVTSEEQFGFWLISDPSDGTALKADYPAYTVAQTTRGTYTLPFDSATTPEKGKYIKLMTLKNAYYGNPAKHTPITIHSITLVKKTNLDELGTTLLDAYKDIFGYVGNAGELGNLKNADTMKYYKKEYNSYTCGNEMKPDYILRKNGAKTLISTEEAKQKYTIPKDYKESKVPDLYFDVMDETLKIASENGIKMRGHTLVWHSQTPSWFFRENYEDNGAFVKPEVMDARIKFYVTNVMEHVYNGKYKDVIYAWDVANEYFHQNKDQNSGWFGVYGNEFVQNGQFTTNPSYVKLAFETADSVLRAAGMRDQVHLFYNDFNTNQVADDIISLIHFLNEKDALNPDGDKLCDGIGMQSHLDVQWPSVNDYLKALKKFQSEGFEIQITELDVTLNRLGQGHTQEEWNQYWRDLMNGLVAAKNDGANITAFVIWGMYDAVSWRAENTPLLWGNSYYDRKPVYNDVIAAAAGYKGSKAKAAQPKLYATEDIVEGKDNEISFTKFFDEPEPPVTPPSTSEPEEPTQPTQPQEKPVTEVRISQSVASLQVGYTLNLFAQASPLDAVESTILWKSTNPQVASVDKDGCVTAISTGIAHIIAYTANGTSAECILTVWDTHLDEPSDQTPTVPEKVKVESIQFKQSSYSLETGDELQLETTITPANATNQNKIWNSSDDATVSVDQNGYVTVKKSGTAVITVTTEDGGYHASCLIEAKDPEIPVEGISAKSTISLVAGAKASIGAKVIPDDATNKKLSYKSDNQKIVSVSSTGSLKAGVPGVTTVRISAANNKTKKITVKVSPKKQATPKAKGITKSSVKISWSKQSGVSGYQLYYCDKSGKYKRYKTTTAASVTVNKLKKSAKYKFKVRAYKKTSSGTLYGAFSNTCSIKTKSK